MATNTQSRTRLRRLLRWAIAWTALLVPCFVLHRLAWNAAAAAEPGTLAASWIVKQAANLVHVISGPGWLLLNALTYNWGYKSAALTLIALGAGLAIVLYTFFCILRLRRLALKPAPSQPGAHPANLSRRRLIVDGGLGVAGLVGAAGLAKGVLLEPWDLTVRRYRIPIADLPPDLADFRIVQIADTHLGPRIPAEYVRHAVTIALSLKPDVFALVGDYIHAGVGYIDPAANLFKPLAATGNAIATLGNHDWYNDGPAMRTALRAAGITTIDNDRLFIDAADRRIVPDLPQRGLCLAGLGDLLEDWVDPDKALAGVPKDMPRIVLAHNPDTAEQKSVTRAKAPRIDVMLSGHTHGGQIRVPGLGTPFLPSRYGQKYAGGLCKGPRFPVLVSRGVGMSIFPIRLGVPPELVEITLVPA